MPGMIDWTGRRQGRLLVLRREPRQGRHIMWAVRCDCGVEKVIRASSLNSEGTSSCGCLQIDVMASILMTHGKSKTSPLYGTWKNIRERCRNPNNPAYKNYGGRGIYLCEEWEDFEQFERDMAPRPSRKHSIDRIDNNGPYSKQNCRWATRQQQSRNSRKARPITLFGETKPIVDWAKDPRCKAGSASTIYTRLNRGWTEEQAILLPWGTKQ